VHTVGGADWSAIDRLRQGLRIPVVLKGIMSAEEAVRPLARASTAIVVSSHGRPESGMAAPIQVLPAIAEAVAGKSGYPHRRQLPPRLGYPEGAGAGARAVMLAVRPLWALAALRARAYRPCSKMLQNELARDMGMCGRPNLKSLDPSLVRIHAPRP